MRRLLNFVGGLATVTAAALSSESATGAIGSSSYARTVDQVQPKIVKIYGAGGLNSLEPYQSGFVISADGYIVTVWSYVLDTDSLTVVLSDGQRLQAKLVGADPKLEVAVLKIDVQGQDAFDLTVIQPTITQNPIVPGSRVLAFSNLFNVAVGNEASSVQRGVLTTRTRLEARRGTFETPYRGDVYVVDAITNNPGAAGGALTDGHGRLIGMLGKELRNAQLGTWLNYAIPVEELAGPVADIIAGRPPNNAEVKKPRIGRAADLSRYGIILVPDVLERTPPYVDAIVPGSAAAKAGLRPDDLIIYLGRQLVPSCKALGDELSQLSAGDRISLVVMRGADAIEVTLNAAEAVDNGASPHP